MKPVKHIRGRVALFVGSNVDTDQIVPARFLSRERREGYADALFRDLSLDTEGRERADFVLNISKYKKPKVLLVAGQNFGCGSSREQAIWALLDHGIDCVIARSFSDIFRNNAVENGLLAIVLPVQAMDDLHESVSKAAPCELEVSLESQTVTGPTGTVYPFDIDANIKKNLLKGLSKIELTLQFGCRIRVFQQTYRQQFSWLE